MSRYKVLPSLVLLLLLCSCSRPDRERHPITETGIRSETVLPSTDEYMENSEEPDSVPERLFAEYEQELARFLKDPNLVTECRKENPYIWDKTVSLADLTGDSVPEVLVSVLEGSMEAGNMSSRTAMYDLRTGEALLDFYLTDPNTFGGTLQGYRDREGKVHYLAVSYIAQSAHVDVEDIVIQDITNANGVFESRCPFVFRLRAESMLGGETPQNECEQFGFYYRNYVFKNLTDKQLALFMPDSESAQSSMEELSKVLNVSSPYEYMEYLSSMTPIRTPWEKAGRFVSSSEEGLVFLPSPGYEKLAEAIGDTYAVWEEAGEQDFYQSQGIEAQPQPEEELSETEKRLNAFLMCPEIKKRREKTRGRKEKITVSLTDLTGDGAPEALLTEGTGEQAETTLYDLDTGEELLRIPAFNPGEDTMFRYQDEKGAIGCKLAERIKQKNGAVDEIYRDVKYQNGQLVLTEENAFKSVTGLEWDGKAVRYLPFLLGKGTKRKTFLKAAGNEKILKLLEKHDMDTEGMEAFVRRAGETCFLPPDIRQAGVIADGRYQKIK